MQPTIAPVIEVTRDYDFGEVFNPADAVAPLPEGWQLTEAEAVAASRRATARRPHPLRRQS